MRFTFYLCTYLFLSISSPYFGLAFNRFPVVDQCSTLPNFSPSPSKYNDKFPIQKENNKKYLYCKIAPSVLIVKCIPCWYSSKRGPKATKRGRGSPQGRWKHVPLKGNRTLLPFSSKASWFSPYTPHSSNQGSSGNQQHKWPNNTPYFHVEAGAFSSG